MHRLDEAKLRGAVKALASSDERLGKLLDCHGVPPLWNRSAGFATLVKVILEQQVSLDSAAAAFANLEAAIGTVVPAALLELDDVVMKQIGFSRQKAGYCRGIARGLLHGTLDLDDLHTRSDSEVRDYLMAIRGVGPWTSDVYLLFALGRPDVWPTGDRALVVSMAESLRLDEVPTYEAAAAMAERWSPWRSVAARMLWHSYLQRRGRALE